MLKKHLFTIVVALLFVACNTNDKYDSSVCQNFIDQYSYETAFNGNSSDYDASLKNISQKEFSEMIEQLKGIITQADTELTNISVIDNRTDMKEQYEQFNDKIMLQHFISLNAIVDDANFRGLLDSINKRAYEDLQPMMENVASTDIKIKNMIR